MHSKLASDWELVTLRKQNKEMKRLKRALFSRDADATASLWRKEHGSKAAGGAAAATRDPDPCPQIVPCMRKHQSRGWNGSNRVGGITTVFREHYKQLGPHWCAPSSTRTTSTA
jgi:hypothetical protein